MQENVCKFQEGVGVEPAQDNTEWITGVMMTIRERREQKQNTESQNEMC